MKLGSMVDLKELWIGEKLKIKGSGKLGTFEGIGESNKAKIYTGGKILLVDPKNLEIAAESVQEMTEGFFVPEGKPVKKKESFKQFSNTIDLHIEILNPDLKNAHPQLILDHQLLMCRNFINHATLKRKNVITIIHGKGRGALKQEVLHLLKEFNNIRFTVEINNGGAQEVWMRY